GVEPGAAGRWNRVLQVAVAQILDERGDVFAGALAPGDQQVSRDGGGVGGSDVPAVGYGDQAPLDADARPASHRDVEVAPPLIDHVLQDGQEAVEDARPPRLNVHHVYWGYASAPRASNSPCR